MQALARSGFSSGEPLPMVMTLKRTFVGISGEGISAGPREPDRTFMCTRGLCHAGRLLSLSPETYGSGPSADLM